MDHADVNVLRQENGAAATSYWRDAMAKKDRTLLGWVQENPVTALIVLVVALFALDVLGGGQLAQAVVQLIGSLAWPVVFVALVWICRRELKLILQGLAERYGPQQKTPSSHEDTAGSASVAASLRELVQSLVQRQASQRPASIHDADLRQMADDYLAAASDAKADPGPLSRRLAAEVLVRGVSRRDLASARHEGFAAGLAQAVRIYPEQGDAPHLLRAAANAEHSATRLLFCEAFAELARQDLMLPESKALAAETLAPWREPATGPLAAALAELDILLAAEAAEPSA
jgi:hypothetical protein